MRMQSKLVLAYLALNILVGAVWVREGYATSMDRQLEFARRQVYEVEHSPSANLQALRNKLHAARESASQVLAQHPQDVEALALAARIDTLLNQLAPPAPGEDSVAREAGATADRLAALIKGGGKRAEIDSLHTHLRKLIQRLAQDESTMAATYKARAQALWELYKPSLAHIADVCSGCPMLDLAALVPEFARPRLLGAGDYTLVDLEEMIRQDYAPLVTGDFNRDGQGDLALVGKNEQKTDFGSFLLIAGLDNNGDYKRLFFEPLDWNKAALGVDGDKLILTENYYAGDDFWYVSWNGKQFVIRYANELFCQKC